MAQRLLLVGETWFTYGTHVKGFSAYGTGAYDEGQREFVAALEGRGWDVTHLPNHLATTQFPWTSEELDAYDVVVLSDISADTIQLHPDTFVHGRRTTDRLALLADWVRAGGAMAMIGGYMAFSGYEGRGRFGMTPLADILPVTMLSGDDRVEAPAGVIPAKVKEHAVLAAVQEAWPHFLGYNRIVAKESADVLLSVGHDPFLVTGDAGAGRVAAFASDCSPHWGSPEFMEWESYAPFWDSLMSWLARR